MNKPAPRPNTPATLAQRRAAKKAKGQAKRLNKQEIATLKKIVAEHNDGRKLNKITLGIASKIFQRGKGAFGSSHSPAVSSPNEWGFRRLQAFLSAARNGWQFKNKPFDTDLVEKIKKNNKKT
jgi:hypothetical protein